MSDLLYRIELYDDLYLVKTPVLTVAFQEIATTDDKADYSVVVMENDQVLWRGKVEGHTKKEGWEALLFVLAEEIYKKKLEAQNAAGEFC